MHNKMPWIYTQLPGDYVLDAETSRSSGENYLMSTEFSLSHSQWRKIFERVIDHTPNIDGAISDWAIMPDNVARYGCLISLIEDAPCRPKAVNHRVKSMEISCLFLGQLLDALTKVIGIECR